MKLIEEIELSNGLALKIFDASRPIAADTVKVELFFQTKTALNASYFTQPDDYRTVQSALGDELAYEHRLERSFVLKESEESTRADLIETFKKNSLNYIASENFPKKMAISALRDIRSNPYKYPSRAAVKPEK